MSVFDNCARSAQRPRVAFFPAGIDACALYRMFIPHLHMPGSKFIFRPGKMRPDEYAGCTVGVVQRLVTQDNLIAIRYMRENGLKVIYDLDDNMWSVPASNPGKQLIEQYKAGFGVCAEAADVVTVSTRGLRSALQSALPGLGREIYVVPNAMDFRLFRPAQVSHTDNRTVIGWAGSNTHSIDLKEAWGSLLEILAQHEQVHMEFVGGTKALGLEQHKRVRVRPWVPVGEFSARFASWSWDIAMAPLEHNRFNNSKSAIKMLEAAALSIPCLASRVRPYEEFCALGGKELEWLLCDSKKEWKEKLERLIVDVDHRKAMGELVYKTAKQWFDIEKIIDNWDYVFEKMGAVA